MSFRSFIIPFLAAGCSQLPTEELTPGAAPDTSPADARRSAVVLVVAQEPVWGGTATFEVQGAIPGEKVYFAWTHNGLGQGICPAPMGGVCLDLAPPNKLIGSDFADASGRARVDFGPLPANGPQGAAMSVQAAVPRGPDSVVSNTVTADVDHDIDGDGWGASDCDEGDPLINPGAREICDGIDNDCDNAVDPACLVVGQADVLLDGTGGFDGAEFAVADFDGDGTASLVSGAVFSDQVFLWDGVTPGVFSLADADVSLRSGGQLNCYGCTLSTDDLDGDGLPELQIGAPFTNGYGQVYVHDDPDSLPANAGPGDAGVTLRGAAGATYFGVYWATRAGDLNDDGVVDILGGIVDIVNPLSRVYALQGPFSGVHVADDAFATVEEDPGGANELGYDAVVADFDGDGRDDALIGDAGGDGAAYLFLGPLAQGALDLPDADLVFRGGPGDGAGGQLEAGDFDGDGILDVAIGAPGASAGVGGGAIYVVHGPFAGDLDLDTDADFVLTAQGAGDRVGHADHGLLVADLDQDGRDDLIVGAALAGAGGVTAVVFGEHLGQGTFAIDEADAVIDGDPGDAAGYGVGVGDVDGDGLNDLVVGTPGRNSNSGGVRVFLGGNF